MSLRVVGLDLALTKSGVARADGTFETLRTNIADGYGRLWTIAERITRVLEHDEPDVVVIEDYAPRAPGRNALIACAEVGGIVRAVVHRRGIPFALVRPSTLKAFAVGNGNAPKTMLLDAAKLELEETHRLDAADAFTFPVNDDEADAYWLRAMGRAHYAARELTRGERARRAIGLEHLSIVSWPELRP